jgi:hypothetical protein
MLSLARGLSVLRAFAKGILVVSDRSRPHQRTRVPSCAAAYTLKKLGYATSADGGYELTPQVLTLGFAYLRSAPLAGYAQPVLERVSGQLHEPVRCRCSIRQTSCMWRAPRRSAFSRLVCLWVAFTGVLHIDGLSAPRGLSPAELSAYLDVVHWSRIPSTPS